MADWRDGLRADIAALSADVPRAVTGHGGLASPLGSGPVSVHLAAWAEALAAPLHRRYGDRLEVVVGRLRYPSGEPEYPLPDHLDLTTMHRVAGDGLEVRPAGELEVVSGRGARCEVHVTNHGPVLVELSSNGSLLSFVVDDHDRIVGSTYGAQTMPYVPFRIEPGATERVPVRVGAAGVTRDVGYAVPPGDWHLVVMLGRGRSPSLLIRVLPDPG